jgi:Domain of unknown function (DUF5060)
MKVFAFIFGPLCFPAQVAYCCMISQNMRYKAMQTVNHKITGFIGLILLALIPSLVGAPKSVSFSQPAGNVEAYDYVEVAAQMNEPDARNPFLEATLSGSFAKADGTDRKDVEGFCDSTNGSSFLIRFMPASPGSTFGRTWAVAGSTGAAMTP